MSMPSSARDHIDAPLFGEDAVWADPLRRKLEGIRGLVETASRLGSRRCLAWRVGKLAVVHLHAPPFVDIRPPRTARPGVGSDPRIVARNGRSDSIECRRRTRGDAALVAALIRLAADLPRAGRE